MYCKSSVFKTVKEVLSIKELRVINMVFHEKHRPCVYVTANSVSAYSDIQSMFV